MSSAETSAGIISHESDPTTIVVDEVESLELRDAKASNLQRQQTETEVDQPYHEAASGNLADVGNPSGHDIDPSKLVVNEVEAKEVKEAHEMEATEDQKVNADADSETKSTASVGHLNSRETKVQERLEQLKALKIRRKQSSQSNRKEIYAEHQRLRTDPSLNRKLELKKSVAEEKLAKLDAEENGEDFERKRAWDWTIEQSEDWDKHLKRKKKNEDQAAFSDYTQAAAKAYRKSLRTIKPDLESYKKDRAQALSSGAVMQRENGELVAIDEDKRFYKDLSSLDFVDNKPDKAGIDRLVSDIDKAEEGRLKNLNRRGRNDGNDVTYMYLAVVLEIILMVPVMTGTRCSTKRFPGFTTNIRRRYETTLSVVLLCRTFVSLYLARLYGVWRG